MGDSLKPSLPESITTVLIALEEGTEFFPRANDLLMRLIEAVRHEAFFSSLWEVNLFVQHMVYFSFSFYAVLN